MSRENNKVGSVRLYDWRMDSQGSGWVDVPAWTTFAKMTINDHQMNWIKTHHLVRSTHDEYEKVCFRLMFDKEYSA